jgi:LPXTG-motif cell wall-anchored protein
MDDDKHVVAIFEKDTEPSSPPSRPNRPSTPSTPSSNPPEQDEIIDIPVEEIPEGSVDINAGIPSQDEEITTVDDETVPEADALPDSLPQTGGIPAGGFYGLGSILAAAGLFLRKKYR